ncbi:MAG: tetratricopeptide repeat protein [Bacteroidales bacterium]|nr:tetratricopeptide repeat protein [Bacteroidales bacterium]MCL2133111.1 tetratricopeptide repeat protein [Bacteroidales bacterium]
MKRKLFTSIFTLLFVALSCNVPERSIVSNEDFQTLLNKSKKYIEGYPHYPDSGLMILRKLLSQQQGKDEALYCGKALNLIGSAYEIKGIYDSAAYYLYEASRIAEEIKADTLQMSIFTNLGILHFAMKNADEAIKYYRQSLEIAEKLKDSIAITHQLNNIGNAYMTLTSEFEKAVSYFEQCMKISSKIRHDLAYKVAGINWAMIYNELGEHDKALKEIKHLIKEYGSNIYADYLLGSIYFKKGNYKEAIHEWKELLRKTLNTREFELTILQNIATVYKHVGNLDSTVVYLEKTYTLRDSLHNQQSVETIQNLKIAYETEKKEAKISNLEKEKQFYTLLGLVLSITLLLVAGIFIFRHKLHKNRIKQLEQEKQLTATQAVLDGEVQERSRIARDLHDGLGSILSVAKYNLADIKKSAVQEIDVERFDKALSLLDESMREMRRVAHHLMPESLSSLGLKQSAADFCSSVAHVKFNWYGEETRFDQKMEVMLYRIMHELVNNALKHSGASHILVEIVRYADRVILTVQDNGCGFDPSVEAKGMGLSNIRTRVAAYKGNLLVDAKPEVGTEVNVELRIEN